MSEIEQGAAAGSPDSAGEDFVRAEGEPQGGERPAEGDAETRESQAAEAGGADAQAAPNPAVSVDAEPAEEPYPVEPGKPRRFFIDFENVHGAGLKGVDELPAEDAVYVFYSQAAETFHIEQAIDILKSKAHVQFVEADAGTTNALDFQLITALFGTADHAYEYFIVSGDGGYDAALKMAKRLGLPQVSRVGNVRCEPPENKAPKSKSRTRRGHSKGKPAEEQPEPPAPAPVKKAKAPAGDTGAQPAAQGASTPQQTAPSGRKPRKSKAVSGEVQARPQAADGDVPDARPQAPAEPAVTPSQPAPAEPGAGHGTAGGAEGRTFGNGEGDGKAKGGRGEEGGDAPREGRPEGSGSRSGEAADGSAISGSDNAQAAGPSGQPAENAAAAVAGEGPDGSVPDGGLAIVQHPGVQLGKPRKRSSRGSRGSGKSGKREKIAALLAENGIELDQQQLSSVMNALNGVKGKQQFYNNFVKEKGRKSGGDLYHQVKSHYDELVEIVRQQ